MGRKEIDSEDWNRAKLDHIALSDAAAERYDELYRDANFATGVYMDYEISVIEDAVKSTPSKQKAIDLGCGTGRDSFVLARHFENVYGYDFSPNMIEVADKKKLRNRIGNAQFKVLDVESQDLPHEKESVCFVNTGFGMGSFVATPEDLFRDIRHVLKPRGIAIFSFYNLRSYSTLLDLQWRPALAARVIPDANRLSVDFDGRRFEIPARAYKIADIRHRLEENFSLLMLTTYPSLTALMPQEIFRSDEAKKLCQEVDQFLCTNTEIAAGPYIVAICRKGGRPLQPRRRLGFGRAYELLEQHGLTDRIKRHAPIKSMEDVKAVLGASFNVRPEIMLKSIVIAREEPEKHPRQPPKMWVVVVQGTKKVDQGKVAKLLELPRESIRFAHQREVEDFTGFMIGAIPPFGFPRTIPVIVDLAVRDFREIWCGTGDPSQSVRLTLEELEQLSANSYAKISK